MLEPCLFKWRRRSICGGRELVTEPEGARRAVHHGWDPRRVDLNVHTADTLRQPQAHTRTHFAHSTDTSRLPRRTTDRPTCRRPPHSPARLTRRSACLTPIDNFDLHPLVSKQLTRDLCPVLPIDPTRKSRESIGSPRLVSWPNCDGNVSRPTCCAVTPWAGRRPRPLTSPDARFLHERDPVDDRE